MLARYVLKKERRQGLRREFLKCAKPLGLYVCVVLSFSRSPWRGKYCVTIAQSWLIRKLCNCCVIKQLKMVDAYLKSLTFDLSIWLAGQRLGIVI